MSDRPAVPLPLSCASVKWRTASTKSGAPRRHGFVVLLLTLLWVSVWGTSRQAGAQPPDETTNVVVQVRSSEPGHPPIVGAAVNLSSETERPQSTTTGFDGLANFPQAPAAVYSVSVSAVGYKSSLPQTVTATTGQKTFLDIFLDPVASGVVDAGNRIELLDRRNTSEYAIRSRAVPRDSRLGTSFWTDFPVGAGNAQSLARILRSVPGFVPNSLNQVHARGESPITNALYLDGFLVPQFAALPVNRAFLLPNAVDSLEIQTGGYAPETGQASGSAIKVTTRATPYYITGNLDIRAGEYNTVENYLTIGGSLNGVRDSLKARDAAQKGNLRVVGGQQVIGDRVLPPADAPANVLNNRNISFLLTASQRYTDYGSETPQPGGKSANNILESDLLFGKFVYTLNQNTEVSALLNYVSGRTQSPNRTGEGDPQGIGFGYGGLQTRASGLLSQDAAGLGIRQKDNNYVNVLNIKHRDKKGGQLSSSFAITRSALDIDTEGTAFPARLNNLPLDNSVAFLPTLNSKYDQVALQFDYTLAPFVGRKRGDTHEVKLGVIYHDITANEGYQFIPQSQTSLNALAAIEPAFLPAGNFNGGRYTLTGNDPQARVITTSREGYYGGVYLQDTWRVAAPLTINYGVRGDFYQMNIKEIKTEVTSYGGNKDDVGSHEFSPRANLALVLPKTSRLKFLRFLSNQTTILRASYNRLFVTPSLGQGDIIPNQGARAFIPGVGLGGGGLPPIVGRSVVPQTTDLYDASLERQFSSRVVAKGTVYHKDITNAVASKQLIPLLQTGLVSTTNLGSVTVDGGEFSLELLPPAQGKNGFHGYLTYANATAAPKSENEVDNLGRSNSAPFLEWDQNNTLNIGAAYTTKTGASLGLNFYYGDGLYASALTNNGVIVRDAEGGKRDSIQELNLRLASGLRSFRRNRAQIGFEVQVENLTNSRARLNYQSYLTGTRYQQERRVLGAITGRF